ncbi:hypothetical protein RYX36_012160 [Vicia faba]
MGDIEMVEELEIIASEDQMNVQKPAIKAITGGWRNASLLLALGSGVFDPALPTLAADQFDEDEPDEQRSKNSIYGYFYASSNLGSLIAETALAYIATTGHWVMVKARNYTHGNTFAA